MSRFHRDGYVVFAALVVGLMLVMALTLWAAYKPVDNLGIPGYKNGQRR